MPMSAVLSPNKVMPGKVDVSPEVLEYAWGVATGGAGVFAKQIIDLPLKLIDPESKIEPKDVPFVSKFYTSKPEWVDKSRFYERRAEIEQVQSYIKKYRAAGEVEKTAEVQRENAPILRLDKLGDMSARQLGDIRKDRAKVRDLEERGRIDAAEMRKRINALKERENALITRFNKAWMEARP